MLEMPLWGARGSHGRREQGGQGSTSQQVRRIQGALGVQSLMEPSVVFLRASEKEDHDQHSGREAWNWMTDF